MCVCFFFSFLWWGFNSFIFFDFIASENGYSIQFSIMYRAEDLLFCFQYADYLSGFQSSYCIELLNKFPVFTFMDGFKCVMCMKIEEAMV